MDINTPEQVRAELNRRKGSWPAICEATELDYSWLQKFADGRIRCPSWDRIVRLYQHFWPESTAA